MLGPGFIYLVPLRTQGAINCRAIIIIELSPFLSVLATQDNDWYDFLIASKRPRLTTILVY